MTFSKTSTRSLAWIALLLGAVGLLVAHAATLDTASCSLVISNGVIVGLSNRLCGETLVCASSAQEAGLSALHRLNQDDLRLEHAKLLPQPNSATRLEWAAEWEQAGAAGADRSANRRRQPP